MPVEIRELSTIDECRQVAVLEKAIWGYTDGEDVVPPPVLMVSAKRGGILLGAFEGRGAMVGFVYSIPGVRDGRLTQWSHMMGVLPGAREQGVALHLKLAQRERALEMGVELIEWTFDPLQAMNAHLNFARLGVVVEEYEENVYGESTSPLHHGTPTDRLIAEWRLTAPHVVRRITQPAVVVRDVGVAHAPVVNPSGDGEPWLRPGVGDTSFDAPRVLVEIPTGFTKMQAEEPALALEWRLATRAVFEGYFARGYRAVDFFLSREARRGQYLLVSERGHSQFSH